MPDEPASNLAEYVCFKVVLYKDHIGLDKQNLWV